VAIAVVLASIVAIAVLVLSGDVLAVLVGATAFVEATGEDAGR